MCLHIIFTGSNLLKRKFEVDFIYYCSQLYSSVICTKYNVSDLGCSGIRKINPEKRKGFWPDISQ
jgi:hypothetical protein